MMRLSMPRRATIQRITFPFLLLLSLVTIIVGKADQVAFDSLRNWVMDAAAPTLDLASRPLAALHSILDRAQGLVTIYRENARLTEENERLLIWQQTALNLASENAELRGLLKLAPEPSASFVTARVIANSGGTYVRNVMVNAGRENGVARGQAAITGEGLVGCVSEVGSRAARILLLTDLNSRIPVIVEGSRQRAVLVGDNSERPVLRYVEPGAAIRIGERIVTSGQGGVFPPGLPVGVVAALAGELAFVEPYVDLSRVEYLRLVDYGLADALPNPVSITRRGGKRAEASTGVPSVRR